MVKMVLSSSDAQGQTMSSVGKTRVDAYNSAVKALSNFNGASDLQGSAYDSGKQYGVSVITPLIKGAIMYSEYLSEAVPKLPSKYRSEVGDEDLDSAVLESEIQNLESSISSLRGSLHAMEGSDHADKSLLQNISSRMDGLTSQKNEKMDKLRKLNLFAGSSNEVFSGEGEVGPINTLIQSIQIGLSQIQAEFTNFSGTFHMPKETSWITDISTQWEEREKKSQLDEDSKKALDRLEKDKKEGKISNDTYQSLRSGIISGGVAFLNELAKSKVIEKGVEGFVKFVWKILAYNPQNTQYGLVGAVAGGGTTTIPINVNPAYSQFVSGVAKYGAPIIGAAIDFTMQVNDGANIVDAGIKTSAHVAIGVGAAKLGSAIGSALVPGAGTVVGGAIGFVAGVAGSMLFDFVYDNKDKIAKFVKDSSDAVVNTVKTKMKEVGDAVSGFFSGLGSVFS